MLSPPPYWFHPRSTPAVLPTRKQKKNTVFHLQITFLQVQFTMLIDNKSLILKVTKYGCVRYLHILAQCKDIGTVRYTGTGTV